METKQGYFDPKMPRALDNRFFKETKQDILDIPIGARYRGMEIYAINEDFWWQFKDGVQDTDLVPSNRGGTGENVPTTGERQDWEWSEGIPGGGNTYLDFVITSATTNDEIANFQSCILFIDKSLQTVNYSIESTNYTNDTVRIVAQSGDEDPDTPVILYYNRVDEDSGGSTPGFIDKEFTSLTTTTDGDAAGAVLSFQPEGYVMIMVNGMQQVVGSADKTKDCYWSRDGGATALPLSGLEAGDTLYWNGSIAGFELDADTITLNYNV